MSAGPECMHFFIKWSKTNQMGRCVQLTKGRHMCPVPAMEAYRECCHCSTHSSPLFHFKDGRILTSKSFRSTFLPLVWWSYVATIQPNITLTLVQPCTVAARTGLPLTPFGTSEEVKQSIPDIHIGAATVHVNSNC